MTWNFALIAALVAIATPVTAQDAQGWVTLGRMIDKRNGTPVWAAVRKDPNPPLGHYVGVELMAQYPTQQQDPVHGAYQQVDMQLLILCQANGAWIESAVEYYDLPTPGRSAKLLWRVDRGLDAIKHWEPIDSFPLGHDVYNYACPGGHPRLNP